MDFGIPIAGNESCVDTVRALHQTIVALRAALEKSRSEILKLKSKNWPDSSVEDTIRHLSVENHVLKQKIVNKQTTKEATPKKENKNKSVKKKESKESIQTKEVDKKKQENAFKNIHIFSEEIGALSKVSKSLENITSQQFKDKKHKNQLSKSRTVCFSNIFEGEKQISTANSLHIKNLQDQASTQVTIKKEDSEEVDSDKHKADEKRTKKSIKNFEFQEEIVDNVIVSRHGSISEFISEVHDTELDNLRQYVECIEASEKLIANPKTIKTKVVGETRDISKNKSKSRDKSPCKQLLKSKGTLVKRKTKGCVEIEDLSNLEDLKRKSSILGQEIELALIKQYPEDNKQKEDKENIFISRREETEQINERQDIRKSGSESCVNETVLNNLKEEKLKITNLEVAFEKEKLDRKENIETENLKTSKEINIESYEENTKTDCIEAEKDFKVVESKDDDLTIEKDHIESNKGNVKGDTGKSEGDNIKLNNEKAEERNEIKEGEIKTGNSNTNSDNTSLKENKDSLSQNNGESNKENGLNLSENSSNTSSQSQKNVEISLKIYKSSKKPIEVDIRTKKQHKKKAKKRSKMTDKSQNTSFEKDHVESNINRLTTTEIRRNIDNATADNIVGNILQNDVEQEVDDIELIFTTDDTKETDFKEELVPIETYAETQLLQCPLSDYEEKLSAEASDRELEDDVFNDNFENENQENCNFQCQTYDFRRENSQIYNSKSDNSINHEDKSLKSYYSYQDSSFENKSLEKDESFDRFEEKASIIETDISKIGIQDVEYNLGRRNTCPNPIQYRPIMHREALGRGLNSRKCRPILAHSNIVRKESGAQTDISALPGSSWRSESSLGHKVKVGENFTTLPSKFPHPGSRLRLSEKTVEARRVLLSDIGFTSMVPELSRSADHLCPPIVRGPTVSSYGQFLRTTDLYSPAYTSQKFVWATTTPSEGSHSQSRYSSQYPLSSPPAPARRCSAPVSPSKKTPVLKTTPSRVRFANGSLPELRGDWTATVDSGESTDSLVEEAEHFLRRSIDCLAPCRDVCFRNNGAKMTGMRRASAPEPSRDNVPPQGWQPFLPRIPRDLHLDYWVKVISPEGRVRGGRVRYVGPLMNQTEPFVGVQLSTPDGHSDGTYNTRRYFNCEPYHGLFVPFKKIIMGWRP